MDKDIVQGVSYFKYEMVQSKQMKYIQFYIWIKTN